MDDLQEILEKLIDQQYSADSNEFEKIGSILANRYSTKQYRIKPQYLFRARKNWDNKKDEPIPQFKNVKELWSPSPEKVEWFGRCNNKKESMLYLSDNNIVPFYEINAREGDVITMIQYEVPKEILLLSIMNPFDLSNRHPDYKRILKNHHFNSISTAKELDLILSSIFVLSEDKNDEEQNLYQVTNAISKILLFDSSIHNSLKANLPTRSNGLIYPSIEGMSRGANYVLYPNYARTVLKELSLAKYIIDKRSDKEFIVRQIEHSVFINNRGDIIWFKNEGGLELVTNLCDFNNG